MRYNVCMDFDWSSAPVPQKPPTVALRAVFRVHADPSYDVPKNLPHVREWVALRTYAGRGSLTLAGRPPLSVPPGTLLLFPHAAVRHYGCAADHWHFYWFEFDAADWLDMPKLSILQVEPFDRELDGCGQCLSTLRGGEESGHRLASALFAVLLSQWLLSQEASAGPNPGRQAVQTALWHMEATLGQPFSLRTIASQTAFCERRLRQLFQIETGQSPKRHHTRLRMEKAEAMLVSTSFPIGRIADALGYANAFHFSRHFRQERGMSPTQFRQRAREP